MQVDKLGQPTQGEPRPMERLGSNHVGERFGIVGLRIFLDGRDVSRLVDEAMEGPEGWVYMIDEAHCAWPEGNAECPQGVPYFRRVYGRVTFNGP